MNEVIGFFSCSGKIYYELLEKRRYEEKDDVAIVRVEQLSPFPFDKVSGLLGHLNGQAHFRQAPVVAQGLDSPILAQGLDPSSIAPNRPHFSADLV